MWIISQVNRFVNNEYIEYYVLFNMKGLRRNREKYSFFSMFGLSMCTFIFYKVKTNKLGCTLFAFFVALILFKALNKRLFSLLLCIVVCLGDK